jgi:hypothetical protein
MIKRSLDIAGFVLLLIVIGCVFALAGWALSDIGGKITHLFWR